MDIFWIPDPEPHNNRCGSATPCFTLYNIDTCCTQYSTLAHICTVHSTVHWHIYCTQYSTLTHCTQYSTLTTYTMQYKTVHSMAHWHACTLGWVNFSEFEITVCGSCKMSKKINRPFLI